MKIPGRRFLRLAIGAGALPTVSLVAKAQTYPSRPITIVVPLPAGGALDVLARNLAEKTSAGRRERHFARNCRMSSSGELAPPVDGVAVRLTKVAGRKAAPTRHRGAPLPTGLAPGYKSCGEPGHFAGARETIGVRAAGGGAGVHDVGRVRRQGYLLL
jgi:hypothetical protein